MKYNLFKSWLVLPFILFFVSVAYPASAQTFEDTLNSLEKESGGRIGVYAVDTSNGQKLMYRAQEKFPFASTGKVMAVAAILKKSESDPGFLQKKITYTQKDTQKSGYAPMTEKFIAEGMSVSALGQATIEYSDNAALNLLMNQLGGTEEVNRYARSIGDQSFRIDRFEPELNSAIPEDPRDTTTPLAMGESLRKLTLGNTLQPPQQALLLDWMKNNTTGNAKIRAGTPKGWIVGDKTGHGAYGTTNDIGIVWPPQCKPILMVIYFTAEKPDTNDHSDIIAAVTRLILADFSQKDLCLKQNLTY